MILTYNTNKLQHPSALFIRLSPPPILPPSPPITIRPSEPLSAFLQVQYLLFTPLIWHPSPQDMRHCYTQVHNGLCCNKLCIYVLAAGNICIHLLYTCLRHSLHQWRIAPRTIQPPLHLLSCKSSDHPMVESAQHPPNVWEHKPYL